MNEKEKQEFLASVVQPVSDKPNPGKIILIYSETGVGKTVSALQSLPLPICLICAEYRNAEISVEASGRKLTRGDFKDVKDYVLVPYRKWKPMVEFINHTEFFSPFKSVVLDGLTQLTNSLLIEITDGTSQLSEKKASELSEERRMALESKPTQEGYGVLANYMNRAIIALGKLSQEGKIVVMNALLDDSPKGAYGPTAVPSLAGQKFGIDLPGACDLIGMAVRRYVEKTYNDKNGNKATILIPKFPPLVKFECGKGEKFECKWTGRRIKKVDVKTGKEETLDFMHFPLDYNILVG